MAVQTQSLVLDTDEQTTSSSSYVALYVGELAPETTEAMLFQKLSTCGSIFSIRVMRDKITRQSLGYAYVNFYKHSDAKMALDTMNYDLLNGRSMRIMWSQYDLSLRRSRPGNVFIKNLDKSIDTKNLKDIFSVFGNILSCKVPMDPNGDSKCHGFIQFENEEDANKAIKKVNGMLVENKKVYVSHFMPKKEREKVLRAKANKFSNIFIKNFDNDFGDEKLHDIFSQFGEISSYKVAVGPDGKNKGFGFVSFKDSESAQKAVEDMNGKEINGKILYVGRAQKKEDRIKELKKNYELLKIQRRNISKGLNLYVKNINNTIDDEMFKKEFEPYGTVQSAKIMYEEGRHKGFGFVSFSSPAEAMKAMKEMNHRILVDKPLYVSHAQSKEDRRAYLANQYSQRTIGMGK